MDHKTDTTIPSKFHISRTRRGNESKGVSNVSNVTDNTHSYHEDTISDSGVFLNLSEIPVDDSGYLAGESRNADLTAFNATESLSSSYEMTKVSYGKDEDKDEEEMEEEEEQMGNDVTVAAAEATYIVQTKEDIQRLSRWIPLAESTRIDSKTSRFIPLAESTKISSELPNESSRSFVDSSSSKSYNDTTVKDNTTYTKEDLCKPRCSGKKEPGTFSQDIPQDDVDGDALYAEIREVYISFKKMELQNGRPHGVLEMEQFELEIKKIVQKFCEG